MTTRNLESFGDKFEKKVRKLNRPLGSAKYSPSSIARKVVLDTRLDKEPIDTAVSNTQRDICIEIIKRAVQTEGIEPILLDLAEDIVRIKAEIEELKNGKSN